MTDKENTISERPTHTFANQYKANLANAEI